MSHKPHTILGKPASLSKSVRNKGSQKIKKPQGNCCCPKGR